jgi:putative DNA primase/helicase
LLGEGGNGKSVFYEIVNALLGTTNISQYSMKSLTDNSNYYIAKMPNKLLNYCSEFKEIGDLDKAKKMISNEILDARNPYGEPFNFRFDTKVMFNSNSLPKDNIEQNEAFFRRLLIIPFNVTITDNEKDVELPKKIIENELAGVFLWVLNGLQRLLITKKFTYSKLAENELNHYKNTSDTVSMFLSENNYKPTKEQTSKLLMDLFNEYRNYCLECGYKCLGKNNFSERLQKKHKYIIEKKRDSMHVYLDKIL